MASKIPDFTDSEIKLVSQSLYERYGRSIDLEVAEAELQLGAENDPLTPCPAIYWQERGAHFVVVKVGDSRFRCQFFYSETTQYGTGKDVFDNLGDCVITLLQVQSDHERQMQGIRSGTTATDFDNYDGPLVI